MGGRRWRLGIAGVHIGAWFLTAWVDYGVLLLTAYGEVGLGHGMHGTRTPVQDGVVGGLHDPGVYIHTSRIVLTGRASASASASASYRRFLFVLVRRGRAFHA